jgi:hypothetical protein
MLLNLSVRRASTILGGLALAAGAIVSAGPAALASTAKPSTAAALCPINNDKQNGEEVLSAGGGDVQLWYSPTCRTAWGVLINQAVNAEITVANTDGEGEVTYVTVSGKRTVTFAIDDANIKSWACGFYPNGIQQIGCTARF